MAVGLLLAILLDQKIRAEGLLRTIYLYPMALSLHRHRHGLEVDAQPQPGHRKNDAGTGASRTLSSSWLVDTGHGHLLRGHRGHLAERRL
jgi:glucose/mannose transport system permease protein